MFPGEYEYMFGSNKPSLEECSPELKETRILTVDGYDCEVFYNFVPDGRYGMQPIDCWMGFCFIGDDYWFHCSAKEGIKDINEACKIILPYFTKAAKRFQEKMNLTVKDN